MSLMTRVLGRVAPAIGIAALLAVTGTSDGRVTQISITSNTSPAFNGQSFGTVGQYEQIKGIAKGEIDPPDRRNAVITDINLAPRNARAMIEYTTTFTLLKPLDITKSSHVLLYDIVNRGNHTLATVFNLGGDPGDGFLYRSGHVLLAAGWQGDLPIASVASTQEGIDVPTAKNPDGSPVTGPTFARFVAVPGNVSTRSLPGLGRTPASTDTTKATLISFQHETNTGVKSGVVAIPSTDWSFADCRSTAFPGTPDPTRICLKNGFDPNLGYELVYTAKDPLVLGVGMAAMRDIVSFFRYVSADDAGTANPIAGSIAWTIGYGGSQSGRFLKNFILDGFNEDEQGRIVWDGADAYIAGQMGQFNIRFAQPGNIALLYEPGAEGPLWWSDYNDVVRGRGTTSLLMRCRATATCPKIFEDYGGPEMWYTRAGIGIVGTDAAGASGEIPLPDNVRRYYYTRACSHYRSPSTMSAKLMKATNMTSSFSNREKMRRKPLSRRNSRSISLRRLYMAWLYSHAVTRPCLGGTTGTKPRSSASCRVSSPSYARSISRYIGHGVLPSLRSSLRPSGASWAWPGDSANVMAVRASAATI